jgi:hypothetical protein
LLRAVGALEQATRMLQEEGMSSSEHVASVREQAATVDALKRLYDSLLVRVGNLEAGQDEVKKMVQEILGRTPFKRPGGGRK